MIMLKLGDQTANFFLGLDERNRQAIIMNKRKRYPRLHVEPKTEERKEERKKQIRD